MKLLVYILFHLRDTMLVLRLHVSPLLEFIKQEVVLVNPSLVEIKSLIYFLLLVYHRLHFQHGLVQKLVDDPSHSRFESEPI